MNKYSFSQLFNPFAADNTDGLIDNSSDGSIDNSLVSQLPAVDALHSSSDSFLVSFESGAPAIVDEPAFHFSSSLVVPPPSADTTLNKHDGFNAVFADLGWNAGNAGNAFDAFANGAGALSHTQSSPGSTSGGGGTSGAAGSSLVTNTAASGLTVNIIYDFERQQRPCRFHDAGQCRGPVSQEPV